MMIQETRLIKKTKGLTPLRDNPIFNLMFSAELDQKPNHQLELVEVIELLVRKALRLINSLDLERDQS
jgi:hypothetical protein